MDYSPAVIVKAQQCETLLRRVAAGDACATVCADLGLTVTPAELARLQAKYAAGGQHWTALLDGRFGHTQCVTSAMREWLYERKRQDARLRGPALATALAQEFGVQVAAGHINYLLRKVGLSGPPGRPCKTSARAPAPPAESPPLSGLANAGLFFPGGREAGAGGAPGRAADPGNGGD
jgi:transposase